MAVAAIHNNPGVSIAMATFNGQAFLAAQLDSILSQTYTDFELVIVDDASTDGTQKLLIAYQEKDERIKVFLNDENTGYKKTFYNAVGLCTRSFILFCDQDDTWVPHKIETLMNGIGNNLLIFSDSMLIDDNGSSMKIKLSNTVNMIQPGSVGVNRGFVIGNCVWGHTILFHRELLSYIGASPAPHPHDWWFALVASHLNKIVYCAQILNHYRQHKKNVTQALPVNTGHVAGRKKAEFETQLSRIESISSLEFNTDRVFYEEWKNLLLERKMAFSTNLFRFLIKHRKDIFAFKRKSLLAQLIEIRKMCRKV